MNPVISQLAEELGETVWYDNKSTAYITLDGMDNSKTVLIGAHLDTLGMVVRCIDADGMIVILDQPVSSKADVTALGIRHGDL